jgi:hypothetical protein
MLLRIWIALVVSALATFGQAPQQIRAGAFVADITPRQWPVRLIGGFTQPLADSAHDALHARAIVPDDGWAKVAIVVIDSCYPPRALFDAASWLAWPHRVAYSGSRWKCRGMGDSTLGAGLPRLGFPEMPTCCLPLISCHPPGVRSS